MSKYEKINQHSTQKDPTTSSTLSPEWSSLKVIGSADGRPSINKLVDEHGRVYYDLPVEHFHEIQQLVARMLKGILNVSDIVTVIDDSGKKKYLSYELPLENIERDTSEDEIRVDSKIITVLFNDPDIRDLKELDGKVAYFDFGASWGYYFNTDVNFGLKYTHFNEKQLQLFRSKLQLLRERFAGKEGKEFLRNIVKSVGTGDIVTMLKLRPDQKESSSEKIFDDFYTTFMSRIERIDSEAEQALTSLSSQ